MSAARPLPEPVDPRTMDHFVYLHVDWNGYQQLLAMRGESSVPRITYLEGLAELMSPSRYHEIDKTRFARLLETWSEIAGVPLEGYGSWTLEDEKADRGAEADECYTVRRVVKSDEERPDIAIEVVWTSGGASTSSRFIASSACAKSGSTSAARCASSRCGAKAATTCTAKSRAASCCRSYRSTFCSLA